MIFFKPGAGEPFFSALGAGAIEELSLGYKDGNPKPGNRRVVFTAWKHFSKKSPLLESGLIGTVVLLSAVIKHLELFYQFFSLYCFGETPVSL